MPTGTVNANLIERNQINKGQVIKYREREWIAVRRLNRDFGDTGTSTRA